MNAPAHERPISAAEVARDFFARSPAWFYTHRPDLEALGFPKPIPIHGGYLPSKVRAWLGLDDVPASGAKSSTFDEGLKRLANGRRKRPAA